MQCGNLFVLRQSSSNRPKVRHDLPSVYHCMATTTVNCIVSLLGIYSLNTDQGKRGKQTPLPLGADLKETKWRTSTIIFRWRFEEGEEKAPLPLDEDLKKTKKGHHYLIDYEFWKPLNDPPSSWTEWRYNFVLLHEETKQANEWRRLWRLCGWMAFAGVW